MKLCVNDMLYAFSYALDCIEKEVLGAGSVNHSKRVACISTFIGNIMGFTDYEKLDLATCALLHDNALTECINDEKNKKANKEKSGNESYNLLKGHCIKGEENMKNVPTYGDVTDVVKYHHEHVDGSGTFGLIGDETPLFSKIIHLADQVDVIFDFNSFNDEKIHGVRTHLEKRKGTFYDTEVVDIFIKHADINMFTKLLDENLDEYLQELMPEVIRDYDMKTIVKFIDLFAKIIDYKSEFTQVHTNQLTKKAYHMCEFYNYDEDTKIKFYMAAGLHDLGKLTIDTAILEKPDKLDEEEFKHIKTHAYHTYKILSKIKNIDDVLRWSSYHHEKLDGTGYPFGKTASELDEKCRLMACLDIYQALREERPYKKGFTHEMAISILRKMEDKGFIDGRIVSDVDKAFVDYCN